MNAPSTIRPTAQPLRLIRLPLKLRTAAAYPTSFEPRGVVFAAPLYRGRRLQPKKPRPA